MRLKVEFKVEVPDNLEPGQAHEWLLYMLGESGKMSTEDPLLDTDLKAYGVWIKSA